MIPSLLRDQDHLFLLGRLLMSPQQGRSQAELALGNFQDFINNEFKPVANEDSLPNEIEVYENLLRGQEEIADLCRFPLLAGRHIIAIGGAFSSGKSSFINSFLNKDILPTAIERTTALPTYIVKANAEAISAVTCAGRLQQLRANDFKFLTHNSAKDYNINLSTFLRYLTLSSPAMPFEHIAFLDTPGYSSDPQYGVPLSDEEIARQHLRKADAVVWCVDLENGDLRATDIDFLHHLDHNRPLFVVFTKADLKDPKELQEIRAQAEQTLRNNGLKVAGVAMYSSHFPEEYPAKELTNFLQGIGKKEKTSSWSDTIHDTFRFYSDFHSGERDKLEPQISLLNQLTLVLAAEAGVPQASYKPASTKKTLADYDDNQSCQQELNKKGDSFLFTMGLKIFGGTACDYREATADDRKHLTSKVYSDKEESFDNSQKLLSTMNELLDGLRKRHKEHSCFVGKFAELETKVGTHLDAIKAALDVEIVQGWRKLQDLSHRQILMKRIHERIVQICNARIEELSISIDAFTLPVDNFTDRREIVDEITVEVPQCLFLKTIPWLRKRKPTPVTKIVTVVADTPHTCAEMAKIAPVLIEWNERFHRDTRLALTEAVHLRTGDLPDGVAPELVATIMQTSENILSEIMIKFTCDHMEPWEKHFGGFESIKNDGLPILTETIRQWMISHMKMLDYIPLHFTNRLGNELVS